MTDEEREREQTEHTRRNYQDIGKSQRAWGSVVEAAGEMEGWECNDCGKLISGERIYYHGEGSPKNPRPESRRECCPYCGSEDVSPVGLVENEQRFESGGDVNQQWKKAMSLERAIAAGIRDALVTFGYMSDAVDKFLNDEDGYDIFLDEAGATAVGKQSFGDAWMNVLRVAGEFLGPAELEELEAMLKEEVENIQEEEGIDLFEDED